MCALTRSEAQSLASSSQPKGVAEAMDPAGKGKKGEKGNKGGWTENWAGKGMRPGGGGGAAVWRQNLRSLAEFHCPNMEIGQFLFQLALYTQQHTGVMKLDFESTRMYLIRVKQQVAEGLLLLG